MSFDFFNFKDEFRWIFLGAIVGLVISAWLFFDPRVTSYLVGEQSVERVSVGTLVAFENDVRKKPSQQIAWQSSMARQKFQVGDSIYVGSKSHATFSMQNGGSLEILPDSLITFTYSQTKIPQVYLTRGNMEVLAGENTLVVVGNKTLNLKKGSRIQLKKAKQSVQVDVKEGQAELIDPKSNQPISEVHNSISMDTGTNEPETTPPPLPVPQIAQPQILPRPVEQVQADVPLPAPAVAAEPITPPAEVPVTAAPAPIAQQTKRAVEVQPLSPKTNSEIIFYSDQPQHELNLSWSSPGQDLVHLQVSKSGYFINNAVDVVLPKGSFSAANLNAGTYFWRVRAEAKDIEPRWSLPASFKITRGVLLDSADLIFPRGKVHAQHTNSVQYRWRSSLKAHRFALSIYDSKLGAKTYFTTEKNQAVAFSSRTQVNWKVYALLDTETSESLRSPASEYLVAADILGVNHELTVGIGYHSFSGFQQGPQDLTLKAQGQGPDLSFQYSQRWKDSDWWASAQLQIQSNSLSGAGASGQATNLNYSLGLERRFDHNSQYVWALGANLEKVSFNVLSTSNSVYTIDDYYFSPYVDVKLPFRNGKDQLEMQGKYSVNISNPLQFWFITPEVVWWHEEHWGLGLSYKSQYPYYGLPYGSLHESGGLSDQTQQLNATIYYKLTY